MIKINEQFTIDSDKYCWHLIETYEGKDKAGNIKPQSKTSYHRNLPQVCKEIINREIKGCESLEAVIKCYEQSTQKLIDELKEQQS